MIPDSPPREARDFSRGSTSHYVDGRRKKTSTSPNFVYRCVNPKKDTYNVDVIIKKKVRKKYKTVAKLNILFDGVNYPRLKSQACSAQA